MLKILFVCTANICRSPTAEIVFKTLATRAGVANAISSASCGIEGYHVGEPADLRAINHGRKRGFDLTACRGRRLAVEDFMRYDLVLACDSDHLRVMNRIAPSQARNKIKLLMDYAPELGVQDIPDPYYGSAATFEQALDMIEAACTGLLDSLLTEHFPQVRAERMRTLRKA
jgi:low molecular weight protein-tyrosine phosphatase